MRKLIALLLLLAHFGAAAFDAVTPGATLQFPRDMGSHPGHRIEWWYVTGQLDREDRAGPLGFQVTFFRVRNPDAEGNPSLFSPRQILFAHAALSDPSIGHLLHDQRTARAIEGLVEARTGDVAVRIDDWFLRREGAAYHARIAAEGFTIDLALEPSQAPMLQGQGGFSRKGPSLANASYYYSEPQLRATGKVIVDGKATGVRGSAWLDHEWSSEYLAPDASGWDWLGANLDGGAALMAFRIRGKDGGTVWSAAAYRSAGGETVRSEGDAVSFIPRHTWKSPRSGTVYPVQMDVRVGERTWSLAPLMEDQELDARTSTGTLYWEGAVAISGASSGRGYLELTGYAERVPF
jgi:predicted secreted hydrolase